MSIAQGTGQGKNWKGAAVNARFDCWRGYGRPRLSGPRRLPGTASTTRRRTGGRHIPRPAPRGAVISSGRAAPRSAAVSGGRAAPRRAAPRRQLAAAARLFGRRRPLRRQ